MTSNVRDSTTAGTRKPTVASADLLGVEDDFDVAFETSSLLDR